MPSYGEGVQRARGRRLAFHVLGTHGHGLVPVSQALDDTIRP